jgi:hypothetical protein
LPVGTYKITSTLLVTNSTNLRFAGRSSVLKYTGTTDAVAATNFQGLVIAGGGTIDISGAGASANGIHLTGVWMATIRDMKIVQGPASSIGLLLETGAPRSAPIASTSWWGRVVQVQHRRGRPCADPGGHA